MLTFYCADAEYEQAIVRFVLGGVVQGFLVFFVPLQPWMLPSFLTYMAASTVLFWHILHKPGDNVARKIFGQVLDLGAISIILHLCGEAAAPLLGVYLWVIVGNGLRYGIPYLLSAAAIATLFFAMVVFTTPFWQANRSLALGIGLMHCVVPAYFAVLLRRFKGLSLELERRSLYDDLTGLMNRQTFYEHLKNEFSRLQRLPAPCSIILVNVDRFRQVNDRYGHWVGDAVLQNIAQAIEKTCRGIDIVSRFGDEEFALLLPGYGVEDQSAFGERLRHEIADLETNVNDRHFQVTVSVGIAHWSLEYLTVEEWLQQAGRALSKAREQGGDRVVTLACDRDRLRQFIN